MQWIRSDFKLIRTIQDHFTEDSISRLEELNVNTLEDLLVLWEIEGLKDLLAIKLEMDVAKLEDQIAQSSSKLELSRLQYLKPLDNEVLSMCAFGLSEPEFEKAVLPNEKQKIKVAKAYHAELETTSVNYTPKLKPVQSQGSRGTCVAFGTAVVREFVAGESCPKLSEQYLYYCAKKRDVGREDLPGTQIKHAVLGLREQGICTDQVWPYNPEPGETEHQGPPPAGADADAKQFIISEGIPVVPDSVDSLRALLAGTSELSGRLISFGVPVFKSWYRNPITYRTGRLPMPLPDEEHIGGHCMTLVGYQDDKDWPGGGYFIFRNSWGEEWASDSEFGPGYGTIPYAFIANYCWEAWTMKADSYRFENQPVLSKRSVISGIVLGCLLAGGIWGYSHFFTASTEPVKSTFEKEMFDNESFDKVTEQAETGEQKDGDDQETEGAVVKNVETGDVDIKGPVTTEASEPEFNVDEVKPRNENLTKLQNKFEAEEIAWQELLNKMSNVNLPHLGTYPFYKLFQNAAKDNKLSPALLVGMGQVLSMYREKTHLRNNEGERLVGLMRLKWPNPDFDFKIERIEQLYDPEKNIMVAAEYLAYLLDENDGKIVETLIAYRLQNRRIDVRYCDVDDLSFVRRVKTQTEQVFSEQYNPFEFIPSIKFSSITFFSTLSMAEKMKNYFEEKTGFDFWVEQDRMSPGYKLYILKSREHTDEEIISEIKSKSVELPKQEEGEINN